jgi:hypothetical protein
MKKELNFFLKSLELANVCCGVYTQKDFGNTSRDSKFIIGKVVKQSDLKASQPTPSMKPNTDILHFKDQPMSKSLFICLRRTIPVWNGPKDVNLKMSEEK